MRFSSNLWHFQAFYFFKLSDSCVNFGTIGFQGYYEYTEEGKIRNSTIADFTITLALTALSFSPLAPLGWTLSLIYGGIRLFKGDNIDNWFNKFQIW